MQNGNVNGSSPAPGHVVQVNPQQAAAFGLQFLEQVPHTRAQREAYDIATMFLQAVMAGQVTVAPVQQPQPQVQLEAPANDSRGPQ